MSVTINFSKNTSAPWQSNANMLKSTREKIQRQEERDGKIAFFETQKQNLKESGYNRRNCKKAGEVSYLRG